MAAAESKMFLAATVLNDGQIVSYRSLSRELKVHSNVAKKMLYEFHHDQNSKRPGSVYATYLLDGIPQSTVGPDANGHRQDGEDVHMQSSPYMSSPILQESSGEDVIPSRRIILAKEADLEAAKSRFEQIRSVHVYSLSPNSIQNLQILSECNRAISAKRLKDDPLVVGTQYGVIHNNGVKRRTGKRPVFEPPAVTVNKSREPPRTEPQETQQSTQGPSSTGQLSSRGKASTLTLKPESKSTDKITSSKPVPHQREKSDIFKSFSKPKAKLNREETGSSAGGYSALGNLRSVTDSTRGDETKDASDDEEDHSFIGTNKSDPPGQSRSEREEQIRKMMDDEDEEMQDVAEQPTLPSQAPEPVGTPNTQAGSSPEASLVTTGGRRRGRRKVMKKKTIRDEEGYLVTKEEPGWESFSEDEPVPPREKIPASTVSSGADKLKKSGGKPGQGTIMSFFGKR